jgi:hypothetical protein
MPCPCCRSGYESGTASGEPENGAVGVLAFHSPKDALLFAMETQVPVGLGARLEGLYRLAAARRSRFFRQHTVAVVM